MIEHNDQYRTIEGDSSGVYKEKGSKFLAFAYHVKTEEDVKSRLALLRKEYFDARHHCYAYCLGFDGATFRINDDGEPSGTAGRPIHGQLLSRNLTQILVIVIRYFGGVKLGVPGLIHAYKTATADALDQARVVTKSIMERHSVDFKYEQTNQVMKVLKEEGASIHNQHYDNRCFIEYSIRKFHAKRIVDKLQKIEGIVVDLRGEF